MKHTIRTKDYGKTKRVVDVDGYTRGRAIKLFCTECLGYEDHPNDCTANMCPLYPYRGKMLTANAEGRELKEGEKSGYAY
jgi:hypothetical protein